MALSFKPAEIREKLNENPAITTAITAGLIVVAAIVIFFEVHGCGNSTGGFGTGKAFYSDNDGKTTFVDDGSKIPPFDHNGAPAYRAIVFKCGDKEFVNNLEGYPPDVKAKLEEVRAKDPKNVRAYAQYSSQKMVKRPGDATWVSMGSPTAVSVITPKAPAGCASDKLEAAVPP